MEKDELLKKCAPHAAVTELCGTVLERIKEEGQTGAERPFLSIITRTVGKRPDGLREVFLCLAGQDCTDFEVLVIGHNISGDSKHGVLQEIDNAPSVLQNKITYHDVTGGTRTTPINSGFSLAKGSYIAILDDDDLVLANWVSAFCSLFAEHNGKVFHSGILKQEYDRIVSVDGSYASTPVGPFRKEYIEAFDHANMLRLNKCPPHSVAFPRWIFHNYGLRFDETLTTTEDWDFIMRAAFLCGVAETGEITGIYRWWREGDSSRTEHNGQEWDVNKSAIEEKFARSYFILPPGGVVDIINLNKELEHKQHEWNVLKNLYDERVICRQKLSEIRAMMDSLSWKVTAPLRLKETLKGNWKPLKHIEELDYHQACVLHDKMQNSRSTKIADKLRRTLKKQ